MIGRERCNVNFHSQNVHVRELTTITMKTNIQGPKSWYDKNMMFCHILHWTQADMFWQYLGLRTSFLFFQSFCACWMFDQIQNLWSRIFQILIDMIVHLIALPHEMFYVAILICSLTQCILNCILRYLRSKQFHYCYSNVALDSSLDSSIGKVVFRSKIYKGALG